MGIEAVNLGSGIEIPGEKPLTAPGHHSARGQSARGGAPETAILDPAGLGAFNGNPRRHKSTAAVERMNRTLTTQNAADSRGARAGMGFGEVRRRAAPLRLTCTFVVGLPGFEPGTS